MVEQIFHLLGAEDDFAAVARGNIPLIDEATGEDIITRSSKYRQRLGVKTQATTGKGHAFVNGRYFTINDVSDIFYIAVHVDEAPTCRTYFNN